MSTVIAVNYYLQANRERDQVDAARVALIGLEQLEVNKELALLLTAQAAQNTQSAVQDRTLRTILASPGHTKLLLPALRCPPSCPYGDSPIIWNIAGDQVAAVRSDGAVITSHVNISKTRLLSLEFDGNTSELLSLLEQNEPGLWAVDQIEQANLARTKAEAEDGWRSPDDRYWLVETKQKANKKVKLLDRQFNQTICTVAGEIPPYGRPWSHDGRKFITRMDSLVAVWDPNNCNRIVLLTGDIGEVPWIEWNSRGDHIAAMSETGHARVWNLEPIMPQTVIIEGWFEAWSPKGSRILLGLTQTQSPPQRPQRTRRAQRLKRFSVSAGRSVAGA